MARATDNGDLEGILIRQLLECAVCMQRLKDPKSLPCQHTFCKTCVECFVVNTNNVRCPECRTVHCLSSIGIPELSTNATIVSLMEMYPRIDDQGRSTDLKPGCKNACAACGTDTIQADLTACQHCGDVICPVCSAAHKTEMKATLLKTAQRIHGDVQLIYDAKHKLEREVSQIKKKGEDLKAQIEKSVDTFVLELRDRQKELLLCNVAASMEYVMSIAEQRERSNDQVHGNLPNMPTLDTIFLPINAQELIQSIANFGQITKETGDRSIGESADDIAMETTP